ncbi:hypothetical protein BV25DRAFT_283734 [Artomyces pyxidatus]|uniref:Uncharacterized protein n=1 Tax=Artomyces pyxidatus TaxID=48021 RepID=A0ACB8T8E0_9AGAM|nr:hypothetical protein BV25DRAFT_283734 [Artomyces pyxidatus]
MSCSISASSCSSAFTSVSSEPGEPRSCSSSRSSARCSSKCGMSGRGETSPLDPPAACSAAICDCWTLTRLSSCRTKALRESTYCLLMDRFALSGPHEHCARGVSASVIRERGGIDGPHCPMMCKARIGVCRVS